MGFCRLYICTQLNTTQTGTMSPSSVEHLLTQKVRLLARRESPAIDQELENLRQAALEVFFQWQDGLAKFQDLTPFVAILEKKVDLNRSLLKWEQQHIAD
jgi:tryptophan 2,3-dioxygenase